MSDSLLFTDHLLSREQADLSDLGLAWRARSLLSALANGRVRWARNSTHDGDFTLARDSHARPFGRQRTKQERVHILLKSYSFEQEF